jgi:poly(ADP-ribose) glycohydrolase ARH3
MRAVDDSARRRVDEAGWRDRVRGCLLGGALGDAVGAPFEGRTAVPPEYLDQHLSGPGPLIWTDDTALQVATAAYLARLGSWSDFDDDEHAVALARAWDAGPDRGYGPNPPCIFRTVLDGGDWRAAASESFGGLGSLGNGGAMRAAPLGALPAEVDVVAGLARRMAAVTHAHPVGQDGAALVAVAARLALAAPADGSLDPAAVVGTCLKSLHTAEMRGAVAAVSDTLELTSPVAASRVTGNGVAADESAPAALSAFLHHPREPLQAIRFAALMAGDADTVAAVAGSLAGAAAGARALPADLLDRLEGRSVIEEVAEALAVRTRPAVHT